MKYDIEKLHETVDKKIEERANKKRKKLMRKKEKERENEKRGPGSFSYGRRPGSRRNLDQRDVANHSYGYLLILRGYALHGFEVRRN